MAWPFQCSLSDVTEDDLELLVTNKVREGPTLDYKAEMYRSDDAWEILKDVSSFANASGGHIVIGITEDKEGDDGTPGSVVGVRAGDTAQTRIESVCHASIKPPIVGLTARDIQLKSGKSIVAVYVPNSANKPHMITHGKKRDFYCRHERQGLPMSVEELRECVLATYSAEQARCELLSRRAAEIVALAHERTTLWLYAMPLFVQGERLDTFDERVEALLEQPPRIARMVSVFAPDFNRPMPTLDGIESESDWPGKGEASTQLMRVHRTGYVDIANYDIRLDNTIAGQAVSGVVYWWTRVVHDFSTVHLGGEPIVVGARLLNTQTTKISHGVGGKGRQCLCDSITLPDFQLATQSQWRNAAKLLVDRLYNAYGYRGSSEFDEAGTLLGGSHAGVRVEIPWELQRRS